MVKYTKQQLLNMAGAGDLKTMSLNEIEETITEITSQLLEAAHLLEQSGCWCRDKTIQQEYKLTAKQKTRVMEITDQWGEWN